MINPLKLFVRLIIALVFLVVFVLVLLFETILYPFAWALNEETFSDTKEICALIKRDGKAFFTEDR